MRSALGFPGLFLIFQKVIEEFSFNFEFDSVVAGSDCVYIVFDIALLLHAFNVVNIVDDEKSNEHSSAPDKETLYLTGSYIFLRHDTTNLDKDLGIIIIALGSIFYEPRLLALDIGAEIFKNAGGLTVAVDHQLFFYGVRIQIR